MRLFFQSLTSEVLGLSGVTYSNADGYLGSSGVLDDSVLGNYQMSPNVVTVQDKTFISVLGIDAANNKQYIVVYDHFRGKYSDLIDTGLSFGVGDVHHACVIYPTGEGRLFLWGTQRNVQPGKQSLLSISGYGYDVTTWSAWTDLGFSNQPEYPHIYEFANGDIYSVMRTYSGGDWRANILRSQNNASSWADINEFIHMDVTRDERPYPLAVYSDDDVIRCFINHIKFDPVESPQLYYLESYDNGFTWRNIGNTYSKNTSSSSLSIAELQANYTALSVTGATIRANYAVLIDGNPYAIGGINSNNDLGLIFWNGSSWQTKQFVCSGHTFAPSYGASMSNSNVLKKENGVMKLYAQEVVNGYVQTSLFTSSDDGDSWVFVRQLTTGNYNHITAKHNIGEGNDVIVIAKDINGITGDVYIEKI